MKLRIPKRHWSAEALLVHFCRALDRSVPLLRTMFLVAGLIAAATRPGRSGDFLFGTGLLFQFAIWFEGWWVTQRAR